MADAPRSPRCRVRVGQVALTLALMALFLAPSPRTAGAAGAADSSLAITASIVAAHPARAVARPAPAQVPLQWIRVHQVVLVLLQVAGTIEPTTKIQVSVAFTNGRQPGF